MQADFMNLTEPAAMNIQMNARASIKLGVQEYLTMEREKSALSLYQVQTIGYQNTI